MESYTVLMEESKKDIKIADHMINVTYPLIKDPKLIVSVAERLYFSLMNAVNALLGYEHAYKRIDTYPEDYEKKIEVFNTHLVKQYNLDNAILNLIKELKVLVDFRKKSPVEIVQKDKLVVYSSGYNTKSIKFDVIKSYVQEAKVFINKVNGIIENGF